MKRILFFIKKETVLVVAILLAVISMIFIPPDQQYPEYIDFRTLAESIRQNGDYFCFSDALFFFFHAAHK